jgi:hypothetical protein
MERTATIPLEKCKAHLPIHLLDEAGACRRHWCAACLLHFAILTSGSDVLQNRLLAKKKQSEDKREQRTHTRPKRNLGHGGFNPQVFCGGFELVTKRRKTPKVDLGSFGHLFTAALSNDVVCGPIFTPKCTH